MTSGGPRELRLQATREARAGRCGEALGNSAHSGPLAHRRPEPASRLMPQKIPLQALRALPLRSPCVSL